LIVLTIFLIILRATDLVDWSWGVVLAPLWVPPVLQALLVVSGLWYATKDDE